MNVSNFQIEKEIIINEKIEYPSIFFHKDTFYIYYREDVLENGIVIENQQTTKRFILDENFELIKDPSFELQLCLASHNFRIFDINKQIYGIGGQAVGSRVYDCIKTFDDQVKIEYHKDNGNFLLIEGYNLGPQFIGSRFLNPNTKCPYFGNGLHLFEINDNDKPVILNDGLPIISGIKNGRNDGIYGLTIGSNQGLSVFDSTTNLLYNSEKKTYFLYQRSNNASNVRNIQYCTSSNLIDWSDWKMIDFYPSIDIMKTSIYYGNLFKLENVNAIFPVCKINSEENLDEEARYHMYYSINCERFHFIGNLGTFKNYEEWMIIGEPIVKSNKHYFLFTNHKRQSIIIKSFEKNRYSYVENLDKDELSQVTLKPRQIGSKILANFIINEEGFIKCQLVKPDKTVIEGYSLDHFDKINGYQNQFDYPLTWLGKTTEDISGPVSIEIIGKNFKLFSLEF